MRKKRYILHSIGNVENFSYYIFDKKQKDIEKLAQILAKVLGIDMELYKEYRIGKNKWKSKKINFSKIKDEHEGLQGWICNIRGDLFYGDKKLFLTLICPPKSRLKFNNELFRFFDMPKPIKIKKKKKLK